MKTIDGPYGSYKSGSVGAVLNSLVEVYGYSICTIDNLKFSNDKVFQGDILFGMYEWQEDDTLLFVRGSRNFKNCVGCNAIGISPFFNHGHGEGSVEAVKCESCEGFGYTEQ